MPVRSSLTSEEMYDRSRIDQERMLIEQDPFMLEEQRYLNRLQRASNLQEAAYKYHHDRVLLPNATRKRAVEQQEQALIDRRVQSLADAQDRQIRMKQDLTKLHSQAIMRQMQTHQQEQRQARDEQ